MNYSDIEVILENVREDIIQARKKCKEASEVFTQENNKLGNMVSTYSSLINAIDNGLTDNLNDVAWGVLDARKDILVEEFQALKVVVQSVVDTTPSEF